MLPPAEQRRDEEWFDDLDHNISSFKQKIQSWIKNAEAERQAQLRSKRSVSTKASSQRRSSVRSSSKASSRSPSEKRALEERIKMAELMTEAEYMEKKQSLKLESLRIQLAVEVAKSKARVKKLEASSEVPDDAQVALKSKTSLLDQEQTREEVQGKSQKESEPASTLRKRERCDTNFGEEGNFHVRYHRDKIGMSSDADRVPCNERLYPRKKETSRKPHRMSCVSFFNCRQLQR